MKKRLISLCMALAVMLAPASAAFSDISDSELSQTAAVLDALGIMQGVGGNRFAPGSALTRAQFCKLAVTALGVKNVDAYGSYTIFPDVKNSHWAAPYINAAVRDTELKKLSIIRGYADGTFGPDKTVNFGEACTMLLRMLGYTDADVGPFWPADYIARADSLGLTQNVTITKATDTVTRGNAATLLLNALATEGKDETLLMSKLASSVEENCILVETGETYAALGTDTALFYQDGKLNEASRKTAGTLDSSMIGTYGTLLVGKDADKAVLGIIPNDNKTETYAVTDISADRIVTASQTIRPNRDTNVYVSREHADGKFGEMWSNISPGDQLTLYYDSYGSLILMAVLPQQAAAGGGSFVYGLTSSVNIPQEYSIVKNDVTIDRTKLSKYDVITLDAANKRAIVSDAKLSGMYKSGTPTSSYPQSVKLYEDSYTISDQAASYFKDLKLDDYITLLFDANGQVAAAYPRSAVSADMQGVVTGLNEGVATLSLMNGLTVRAALGNENGGEQLMGRLVTLGQSNNKAYATLRSLSGKESGDWSVTAGKLGSRTVSPKVRVYEEVLTDAPLNQITRSDIEPATVSSGQIRYTFMDNAGTITNIVLGDVTGKSWLYGIGFGNSEKLDEDSYDYTVVLRHWRDGKSVSDPFKVDTMPSGMGGAPVGVPKGYSTASTVNHTKFDVQPLTLVETVKLSAFDGTAGVRTKNGYYDVSEDAGVYVSERGEFISLASAKNNYTDFRLYTNKTASDGGVIRLIVAS